MTCTDLRQAALALLHRCRPEDFALCREVEACCRAAAPSREDYRDHVLRAAFNLRENEGVGADVVYLDDETLAEPTAVGRIAAEVAARTARFDRMLQEKYEALDDRKFAAIVRCRRCGSEDVSWEEKQTRSADEGATVFCVCTTCQNRWVMR
jgi:DNA-directed RNA polymerase subunit M/transcription elongation factor TFIIS